jgi:NitT/TauT family transport system permease protein
MLRPLEPVGTRLRVILGISFFVLFIAFWSGLTFGGIINKLFLANPVQMLSDGWRLLVQDGFIFDILITVWRVIGGFVLAAVVAVPIGILMGSSAPAESFLGPAVSFARYLPVSAFIPLLVLWAGIGEMQKLLVIFLGSVFQIILMVSVAVASTRRDLVEAAYTLGSTPSSLVKRVIIPANAPDIAEILRLVLGWAWTYVIVAELIGASSGIGYMITSSTARIATGQIIFGIIIIGLIGMVSDFLFKALNRHLFLWRLA